MKKQEIIDEATKLLDAYKKKVKEVEEVNKRLGVAEKHKAKAAATVAREATVQGVIDTLGQLRAQLGKTLNVLTDKMSEQAEKLEGLNSAIDVQEKRLKELHNIEAAADSLSKLVAAYDERRETVEREFAARMAELEANYQSRGDELETSFAQRKDAVDKEMAETRTAWKLEQERARKEDGEQKAETKKTRQREEAEYAYARDRGRRLEEDKYEEEKATREKELTERVAGAEKELTEREAAVEAQEKELTELQARVDGFPKTLDKELERVGKEVSAAVKKEMEQAAKLAAVEHGWEKKILQEKVAHLEGIVAAQDSKVEELKAELGVARKQVQQIADKAVEGASLGRAFQSVNKIALEQARKPKEE